MILTNFISVLGLLVSAFFAYGRVYVGLAEPTFFPSLVSLFLLGVFTVSYIFSLFEMRNAFAKAAALVVVFGGLILTSLFSILVVLGKSNYPRVAGVSGAYIELILTVFLIYLWNREHR